MADATPPRGPLKLDSFEVDINEFGEILLAIPPVRLATEPDGYVGRRDHLRLLAGHRVLAAIGPMESDLAGEIAAAPALTLVESDGEQPRRVWHLENRPPPGSVERA